jgi:hypothetical protein
MRLCCVDRRVTAPRDSNTADGHWWTVFRFVFYCPVVRDSHLYMWADSAVK